MSSNPATLELPAEVKEISHEINLEVVPKTFVQEYLKKIIPKSVFARTDISAFLLKLEIDFRKRTKPYHRKALIRAKLKRQLKLYDVKKEGLKFEQFVRIHVLWKAYIESVLENFTDMNLIYQKLLRADYHGAFFVVAHSCCGTHVGQRGLVVQETKNTFRLLTPTDKVVTIPKHKSIFAFELNGRLFKIYGTNFCIRPDERSKAKMKSKVLDHL